MRLKHLRITNCSRISDVDIEIRDNMVLIGPNGAGKSTVLLCLDMLLGMSDEELAGALSGRFLRDSSKPMTVEAVLGSPDYAATTLEEDARLGGSTYADANARLGETMPPGENALSNGNAPFGVYARTGVDAPPGGRELSVKLDAHLGDEGLAISRSLPPHRADGGTSETRASAFGWTLLGPTSARPASDAQLMANENGRGTPIQEYSDGMRALHAVSIHSRQHDADSIMAIDEPEAHLHPSSQRSLVKMMKASGTQLVLVTHSPTIAGAFEPDEIVVIRADGTAVQPKKHFLDGNSGVLARWWIGRQLEPLTAGTVIAVEGPSDRVIVSRVASAMGLDLDRRDIVLVETNGCGDMKVVETVFGSGGFGIPLYELVDADASDDVARRLDTDPSDLEARNVFVSTRDLEDEYVRAIGAPKLWRELKAVKTFSKTVFAQCPVGPDGYPSEADLAQFIREKSNRKIPAALVASSLIDASNALAVESVARLLRAASTNAGSRGA